MREWGVAVALFAMLVVTACGDDDSGGEAPTPQAVRCTPVPEGTTRLAIEPKFEAGARRTIKIEKTRDDSQKPEPLRATGTAELRVVSGGPKVAVLRWVTDEVGLPIPQNVDPAAIERFEKLGEKIPVEYST